MSDRHGARDVVAQRLPRLAGCFARDFGDFFAGCFVAGFFAVTFFADFATAAGFALSPFFFFAGKVAV